MTERVRNIVIAVVLAGMAALLTGIYVTNYQRHVRQGEAHATVFVAARDIPAGTSGADAIAHKLLAQKTITRTAVVQGAISDTNQISGSIANESIYAGEQITTSRFSNSAVAGIQGQLKGTMRAYQVHGDPNQLLAGTLRPGDHVDLVATFKYTANASSGNQISGAATRTVLRDVLVLRPSSGDASTKVATGSVTGSSAVILRVTDAQAQKLDFTINVAVRGGDDNPNWHLTLRSPLKADDSPESVTTFDSVLLDGLGAQQRARLVGKYKGQ